MAGLVAQRRVALRPLALDGFEMGDVADADGEFDEVENNGLSTADVNNLGVRPKIVFHDLIEGPRANDRERGFLKTGFERGVTAGAAIRGADARLNGGAQAGIIHQMVGQRITCIGD